MTLTLDLATRIIDEALAEGRRRGLAPLTVAVLDPGGHAMALKREDGASILRPQIAHGKAYGALALGFGGRELASRAEKMPAFFTAAIALTGGSMVPVPGGVLVRSNGLLVGAVGVTGDQSLEDEACAVAGIVAAGLDAETGAAQG